MFADKTKRTKRIGSGYKSMYKTPEFKEAQATFEKRLGIYAFKHPRSYNAVNKGLTKMKKVLVTYYKEKITDIEDEREKERKILRQAFTTSRHPDSSGQVGSNISDHELDLIIDKTVYHPGQGAATKEDLDELKKDKDKILVASNAGNLREKMTAFYNAAYYSYGKNCIADKSDGTGGENFTFKNILDQEIIGQKTKKLRSYDAKELPDGATNEQLEENKEIGHARKGSIIDKLGLDYKTIMSIRRKTSRSIRRAGFLSAWFNRTHKRDGLNCVSLALNSPTFREKLRYIKSQLFKLAWYQNNPNKKEGENLQKSLIRKNNYQHEMGLDLSEREKEFQTETLLNNLEEHFSKAEKAGIDINNEREKSKENITNSFNADETKVDTSIRNGKYYKYVTGWYGKRLRKRGFQMINGTSGTTARMLTVYRALGFNNKKDCLDFRLALMGWMLPEEDHSLYEILKGSHVVNVFGDEDLTDAASMDESVSPLSRFELRQHVCERTARSSERTNTTVPMFPIELIYYKQRQTNVISNTLIMLSDDIIYNKSSDKLAEYNAEDKNRYIQNLAELHALKQSLHAKSQKAPNASRIPLLNKNEKTIIQKKIMQLKKEITKFKNNTNLLAKKAAILNYTNNQFAALNTTARLSSIGLLSMSKHSSLIDSFTESLSFKNDTLSTFKNSSLIDSPIGLLYPSNMASPEVKNSYTKEDFKNFKNDLQVEVNMMLDALKSVKNKHKGKVYSGTWWVNGMSTLRKNRTMTSDVFISTSKHPSVAKRFIGGSGQIYSTNVLLVITLNGINGVDLSCSYKLNDPKAQKYALSVINNDELEVLLPPGTKIKIKKIIKNVNLSNYCETAGSLKNNQSDPSVDLNEDNDELKAALKTKSKEGDLIGSLVIAEEVK